ncbi:4-hydroxy-tetrahydrodipicolinate synthase [Paenibacillus glycinis]|uniref:4-hydroxy-tetrahydrodipicolinate synthase n=1 Tax=Paenibacillus glycinis TaxID=2697035 RepID=A0ABW9XQB0_9BACL|nr:4-hydroxy-tetrahydrodipicolinate synthase [Paenibacillus glycinis]NBD24596.1 4-hydroxy-tetrahydrodipicolinate synthase [Paenibacillus glycinis]
MLKSEDLRGIFVPVVTPFSPDDSLDLQSYDRYAGSLLDHGIQGLVINGTTGEAPTVSWEEVRELVRRTKAVLAGKGRSIPVVVGTGTNDTRSTASRTEQAGALGADAALVVVPYYSRPSQAGIIEHFRRASRAGVPVIAYEVPSRTGVSLSADTAAAILELDGVVGLKDSSGGTELFAALKRMGVSKPVLCGDDKHFLAMLSLGAAGGIVASANLRTETFVETCRLIRDGHAARAASAFDSLAPLIELLFRDSNPAPLKWLLAQQGILASGALRLPLLPISEELQRQLAKELKPSASEIDGGR